MQNDKRVIDAAAEFPATFGLRAYPGLTFRVAADPSYVNDAGVVQLVTQVERGGRWGDFAKGTRRELRAEIVSSPPVA